MVTIWSSNVLSAIWLEKVVSVTVENSVELE
jgi:hypothetical protein